jgi:hypothetical protein
MKGVGDRGATMPIKKPRKATIRQIAKKTKKVRPKRK